MKTLQAMFALGLIVAALSPATAETWPLPMPEGDNRIYVDGATISADRITVITPYNYGNRSQHEVDFLLEWAEWGCGLYKRMPVYVSWNVSSDECDTMGAAAAERSPFCLNYHHFACVSR